LAQDVKAVENKMPEDDLMDFEDDDDMEDFDNRDEEED
jgi:hypothetical protein